MSSNRSRLSVLVAVVTAAALLACGAHGASLCTRYASPSGSNRASGSAGHPYRTVQHLIDSLRAGQTGCLEHGTYHQSIKFLHGGSAGAPLTLMSAPGTSARIDGRVYVPRHADYVHVDSLYLDGRNRARLPSPDIDGAYDDFVGDDVTNHHTGICYELGSSGGYGQARYTLIQDNRVHGCGHMPPTNHQHGIYVGNSVGARILDNDIYNNADRGVQLYWNAQHTVVAGNVINHNGEGIEISGDHGTASSNNLITNNVITNSTVRADVLSWWPSGAPKGTGNVVQWNCVHGGRGTIDASGGGFATHDNFQLNPHYANASAGNFSLPSGSLCQQLLSGASSTLAGLTSSLPITVSLTTRQPAPASDPDQVNFASVRATVRRTARRARLHLTGRLSCSEAGKAILVTVDRRTGTGWRRLGWTVAKGCTFRLVRAVPRHTRSLRLDAFVGSRLGATILVRPR